MTFEDFLESLHARLRKPVAPGWGVPDELLPLGDYRRLASLVEQTHVFVTDIDIDDEEFVRTIGEDVLADLETTLPLPFDNFALLKKGPDGAWIFRWILQVEKHLLDSGPPPDDLRNAIFLWISTSASQQLQPAFFTGLVWAHVGGPELRIEVTQASLERYLLARRGPYGEAKNEVAALTKATMMEIAAISHPANYIVQRTPKLTPREARRVSAGEPRPARKRPHYIIVGHDELVTLNPETRERIQAHASPVPHARRGHWRRLAEQCVHARAAGNKKTWIQPTYVGKREFSDERNEYRVAMRSSQQPAPSSTGTS